MGVRVGVAYSRNKLALGTPAHLQRALDISLPWLTAIFYGYLALNHIPTRWLDVKVICIPKAGTPSHTNPKDFLLITLFLLVEDPGKDN